MHASDARGVEHAVRWRNSRASGRTPSVAGYPVGTGGVETYRSLRPASRRDSQPRSDFSSLKRICRASGTAMVRKGSPVRVRQRASQTMLRRGSLVLGVDRVTTSLMDRGSSVQPSGPHRPASAGSRGALRSSSTRYSAMVGRPGTQWVPLDLVGGPRRGQLSRARRSLLDALADGQLDDHLESIAAATRRGRHLL
jgi:hypothetical protein